MNNLKEDLCYCLNLFFEKNDSLYYYQGFNSIAEILISIYGKDNGFQLLDSLSRHLLQELLNNNDLGKII